MAVLVMVLVVVILLVVFVQTGRVIAEDRPVWRSQVAHRGNVAMSGARMLDTAGIRWFRVSGRNLGDDHLPRLRRSAREEMPTDACQVLYSCPSCSTQLHPLPGDCCVFCSYATGGRLVTDPGAVRLQAFRLRRQQRPAASRMDPAVRSSFGKMGSARAPERLEVDGARTGEAIRPRSAAMED